MRQQVIDTLLEIDDIELQVNPQLPAQYAKTIGYLEDDLFKQQIKTCRCKRRFALAQAAYRYDLHRKLLNTFID